MTLIIMCEFKSINARRHCLSKEQFTIMGIVFDYSSTSSESEALSMLLMLDYAPVRGVRAMALSVLSRNRLWLEKILPHFFN